MECLFRPFLLEKIMITELTENSINNLNNKEWHHFLSLVTQSEWLGCLAEEKMEAFWGLENQEKFQEYFSQEIYKWWLEQDEDLKDLVIILYNTSLLVCLSPQEISFEELCKKAAEEKGWRVGETDFLFWQAEVLDMDYKNYSRGCLKIFNKMMYQQI